MTIKPEALAARLAEIEERLTVAPRHGKHGKPGRDGVPGRDGKDGVPGRDGKNGVNGKDGARGAQGEQGPPGRDGADGINGKDGAPGLRGERGEPGRDGVDGKPGPRGLTGKAGAIGPMGPMPRHEWEGTSLRFEIAPNQWGEFVNLQGPQGKRGPVGGGGAAPSSGSDVTLPISYTDLDFAGGTIVASTPFIDGTQTWNDVNTTFTGFKMNITDSASHASSLLVDLKVDGSSTFWITKGGTVNCTYRLATTTVLLAGNIVLTGTTKGGDWSVCAGAGNDADKWFAARGFKLMDPSDGNTIRAQLQAESAGLAEINNGTAGQYRDIKVRTAYATTGMVVPKTSGTGIKVDPDAPTFGWRDLTGAINVKNSGPTVPTFTTYQGSIAQYSFGTATGVVEVFLEYHIPHEYAPGTDMYIHAHWSTIAAPTGDVNWLFEIVQAKGYKQAVFEGTAGSAAPITVSVTDTAATAFRHEIAEVQMSAPGGLIEPGGAPSIAVSITSGAAILTSDAPLFTAADIGRTVRVIGAGAAGGNLDTTVSAFTSTQQVTLANNASTTVTAQNAFRYRVIDSDLLEVDGLILVRCWRNSGRAADTLDVAPFLHFVDIHYQTTGVPGTKQKNPPFYT